MKLLIFLILFQVPIFLGQVGLSFIFINTSYADEIVDGDESRYQYWLYQQNLKRARERAIQNKKSLIEMKASNAGSVPLQKNLPRKVEQVPAKSLSKAIRANNGRAPKSANQTRRYIDAQEEFLNNIPKENKQVQSLLTMIDHTKVYFSINKDGRIKDLLKDDRFREIYSEEMTKDTRRQTYNFFKAYQDFNRNPNEPVSNKLNRDTKVTREKIDTYLETTGIKSKLTRSLTGSYPVPSQPKVYEDDQLSSSTPSEVVE